MKRLLLNLVIIASVLLASCGSSDSGSGTPAQKKKVILFVWDGLRPDVIDPTNTPNLYGLAQKVSSSAITTRHIQHLP